MMLVDIKVFYTFNQCDDFKVVCVGGRRYCAWQGQLDGGDVEVDDIMMNHFSQNVLQ